MPMIQIDLSNIWGEVSLPELLALEQEVSAAHMAFSEDTGAEGELRGWLELPTREQTQELSRIQTAADKIRKRSDVCVVVGTDSCCLGSRAVIELLQGPNRNLTRGKGEPQIFFTGSSLSTRHWNELCKLLEGKDYSVIVVSKYGAELESSIAFRSLRWMLERKYGTDECSRRIYAVTDPEEGYLRQMARENNWKRFAFPANVGERFSLLSAAGLLPMAVAGLDIMGVLWGAAGAKEAFDLRSYENPVWMYAAVRNLMLRSGKAAELFVGFEPGFRRFGSWWQQLFAQAEGKEGKGLLPFFAEYTADLPALGQLAQQGRRNILETMVRFAPPEQSVTIGGDVKDLDGLNYLEGHSLAFVDENACQAVMAAHVDGGVPVIPIDCGPLNEETAGELIFFLELSCAVSAYTLGVNPFEGPRVEEYEGNLFSLLGKPDSTE